MAKKIFAIALTLIMALQLSATAFAQSNNEIQLDESPAAIQKFNAYIATLSPELAQLILEDEELNYMMKRDNYWAPQVKSAPRAVSLPLSAYPSGSFYTVSKAACSDHSICTYAMPSPKPATVVDTKCYNGSTKKNGNCIRYTGTGSIQCKGFADYVYNQYSGVNISPDKLITIPSTVSTIKAITSTDKTGAKDVEAFFQNVPVGSNLRVVFRSAGSDHSIIISAKSSTGVTVYDCNGATGKDCKVANSTKTWEQFATSYKAVKSAWKP